MRFYHGTLATAIAGAALAGCLFAGHPVPQLRGAAAPASPVTAAPLVPGGAPPSAAQVEAAVRRSFVELFKRPDLVLQVVPLKLSPEDERKTRWALGYIHRRCRVEDLLVHGATPSGAVGRLAAKIREVDLFGLRVDLISIDVRDLRVDLPKLMSGRGLSLVGDCQATMEARVLEEDITRAQPDYKVEIRPGNFIVSGKAGVLFIKAGFRLKGSLIPTPENQLVFRPHSLSYGILPIPKALYAASVRRLNPVFDLARFLGTTRAGFDIAFREVVLADRVASVKVGGVIHATPRPAVVR